MRSLFIIVIVLISSCAVKKQDYSKCIDNYNSEILNRIHCSKFDIVNSSTLNETLLKDTLLLKKSTGIEISNFNDRQLTVHFQDNFNSVRLIEYYLDSIVEGKDRNNYIYGNKSFSGMFSIEESNNSLKLYSLYHDDVDANKETTILNKENIPVTIPDTLIYNLFWIDESKKESGLMMVKKNVR